MDKSNHMGSNIGIQVKEKKSLKDTIGDIKSKSQVSFKNIHMKITLTVVILLLLAAVAGLAYNEYLTKIEAVDIYVGQDKIGAARDEGEVMAAVEEIKKDLSKTYDMEIAFTNKISFKETHLKDELLTPIEDLKSSMKSGMGFMVYGYVLSADGNDLGALKTKEDMEMLIEKIKEPFAASMEDGEVLKNIRIIEDIGIDKKKIAFDKIKETDSFYQYLLTGSEEIKIHTIEAGESFWTIAEMHDMSVEDLIAANPDKNPELVQIGDEIKLILPKPLLNVETTSERQYDKQLDFERKVEYDKEKYNTYQEVKVAGENGSSSILESRIRKNGAIVEEEILKEEITKKPVAEIITKGTIEPPKTMATGEFLRPTRGRVSSPYGMRNGRMHRGLDIASGTGTSIKAADGGKVVYVGYRGAYGKMIEIDHENGYRTRYAHNSSLLVEVGERVYKGQEISKMGSTGRSTGSHLHFEVIKSGDNQNPSNYVN